MALEADLQADLKRLIAGARNEKAAKEALVHLFPKLGDVLKIPTGGLYGESSPFLKRRIRESDFARSYFNLIPDTAIWSKSQTEEMISAGPLVAFEIFSEKASKISTEKFSKFRNIFLEILESVSENNEDIYPWFCQLIDNAGLIIHGEDVRAQGFFDLDIDHHITMVLAEMLRPLSPEVRGTLVARAIVDVKDLSFLCSVFRYMAGDVYNESSQGGDADAFGPNTATLRENLVERVRSDARENKIFGSIQPKEILWFWWGAGYGNEVQKYTSNAIEIDNGIAELLSMTVGLVKSSAGNYERVSRRSWEKIVDLEALKRRAQSILEMPQSPLNDIAKRFLAALARRDEF